MKTGPVEPIAVDARQLAALLACSVRQIWRLRAMKLLPKEIRLGGSIVWNRREILEWFESGCPGRKEWEKHRKKRRKPSR